MQITINEATAAERRIPFLAVRASANSLQLVDLGDIATGDSFTLTYSGQTTASIAFNSFTASDGSALITSSLEALSNIAAGEVQVFRIASSQVYAIGFGGTFVGTSVALLTATPTGFTMGTITGGVSDSAITGIGASWPAADIRVSKAAVAEAQGTGTVAEVVDGIYDYIAAAGEVDTLGRFVGSIRTFGVSVYPFSAQIIPSDTGQYLSHSGTAQAGAAGSITLASGASATSDLYVPCFVRVISGTGAGQGRIGSAYNGTSKVMTVVPDWTVTPDNTSEYEVEPLAAVPVDDIANEVQDRILSDGTPFAGNNVDAAITTRATPAQVATELATYDGPTNTEMIARTLLAADYATATALATVDTEVGIIDGIVDAILLDTDSLPSAVVVAAAVWDRVLNAANHNIASSAGRRLRQLDASSITDGTAQAGSANSITLAAGASATDEIYDENKIVITEGTGAGQTRVIVEYNGTTKVAVVNRVWEVTPDATSIYEIIAGAQADIAQHGLAQGGTASTITLSSTASATDDVYLGSHVYISTSNGTGQTRLITAYNGTTKVATVSPDWVVNPTSASVYKIIPIGRSIVNSLGVQAAADVNAEVDAALAEYDPPTNAELVARSLATADYATAAAQTTIAGYIDTEVAAIKAKTDLIPADPATETTLATLATAAALATVDSEVGVIDGLVDALTAAVAALPSAGDSATALLDASNGVETSLTPRQALRVLVALACKVSGAGTGTEVFRNYGDSLDRITATVDNDGNRTAITFDLG